MKPSAAGWIFIAFLLSLGLLALLILIANSGLLTGLGILTTAIFLVGTVEVFRK